jgi:hypothetical protein
MSAQQAFLHWQLQEAVLSQVISLAEAWEFQDLLSLTPPGSELELPLQLHPAVERLTLFQLEPGSALLS